MRQKRVKILVAPLDWGLGHATRCIPIINELLANQCEVVIASSGMQKMLLRDEFPTLRIVDLPGYGISYGRTGSQTTAKIFFQIPKMLIRIKRERRWLDQFIASEGLDGVISDNRYGLFHDQVPSVFICHQLLVKTPFGLKSEKRLLAIHYRMISRFSACWVPDFGAGISLAGELSHPPQLPPFPHRYMGPLSRFSRCPDPGDPDSVLVLLSGPEPQRSILEKIILSQAEYLPRKWTLVRGLPGETSIPTKPPGISIHNHLPAADLGPLICRSGIVIARAGYSTVMDLCCLGKKAVLLPTPGQPEQEYLATHLSREKLAYGVEQKNLDLGSCLREAERFSFVPAPDTTGAGIQAAVGEWLRTIS